VLHIWTVSFVAVWGCCGSSCCCLTDICWFRI
jgi:hypothetical protein